MLDVQELVADIHELARTGKISVEGDDCCCIDELALQWDMRKPTTVAPTGTRRGLSSGPKFSNARGIY